ncbi:MAG: ATP-binding protein [FCB group bacterium]
MSHITKYKLAFDLFGSVIAFNKDNNIAFAGENIIKALSPSGINIENIVGNNFSGDDGKNLLIIINKVRQYQRSYLFKFKKSNQELILFPSGIHNSDYVLLSLKNAVDHLSTLETNLKERVKELECLYSISYLLHTCKDVTEALEKSTEHIRRGFQYPEVTSVVVEYNGIKYINAGGSEKKVKNVLSDLNILKHSESKGEIRVIYHKKLPFLKEEVKLLKEISEKFTRAIEKEERTKLLEKQKKILLSKNKKLLELTDECRQSREKLQTFIRAINDKIHVIDKEFNIVISNKEEIGNSGKCYNKLFDYNQPCKDCPALITIKNNKQASLEKEFQNKFYLLQTYPVFNEDGSVDRIMEVCRDVSKEKKMESQLLESHKLASLGKLVAGVAHEINNPNTFILGNTRIIKEALTDVMPILEEQYAKNSGLKIARLDYNLFKENILTLIDDIYNGAVKIKKIVDELRNFARKDEEVLSDNVNINYLVENTIRLVKKQIKENVKINLELKHEIPPFMGSISKLEQVMINLVLNAAQAIGRENGEINVNTEFDPYNSQVIIAVTDNGKGMDEVTKRNIFDPFFTTKRSEGGIGLGLSISYRIIKEHKGDIEVDSKLDKGTTFTITIPVNQNENGSYSRN